MQAVCELCVAVGETETGSETGSERVRFDCFVHLLCAFDITIFHFSFFRIYIRVNSECLREYLVVPSCPMLWGHMVRLGCV